MITERTQPRDVITDEQLAQVEKYIDRLYDNLGLDVEFSKHFKQRVRDERNIRPITAAELVRLFKQVYKRYGKKIAQLTDEAEMVLRDMKTDINVPVALNVDENGDVHMMAGKTIMRKDDFRTSNPVLAVENVHRSLINMPVPNPRDNESQQDFHSRCMSKLVGDEDYDQDQANAICYGKWEESVTRNNPKSILEKISPQRNLEEGINSDTVSKKFFEQLLDTIEALEDEEGLDDDERCRLMAQLINAEAKKYMKPAQWKKVVAKLHDKHNGGGEQPLTEPAPEGEPAPTGTPGGWPSPVSRPGRFESKRVEEVAPAVEFFTDPTTGNVQARMAGKTLDLKSFVQKAGEHEEVANLIRALQNRIEGEGYHPKQDFKPFIKKYLYKKDENPDVIVRSHPEKDTMTAQFDEDEIEGAMEEDEFFASIMGEANNTDDLSDKSLLEKLKQVLIDES